MNGVKGLILKEIYLRRKTMLAGLAVFFLLFILAVSFCLSFDYGNLKNSATVIPNSIIPLAYAVAGIGILIFSHNSETIAKDVKCRWNILEYTLPLSAQKLAAVRIGLILSANLLGLMISTLFSWIIFILAHQKFTLTTFKNISTIALFVFAFEVVLNILMFRLKDAQKVALCVAAVCFSIYILISLVFAANMVEIDRMFFGRADEEAWAILAEKYLTPILEVRDKLFPCFILLFAAIAVIGYFLFLRQIKRREK